MSFFTHFILKVIFEVFAIVEYIKPRKRNLDKSIILKELKH